MNKFAITALTITALDAMGIGLIMPVLPTLLREYVSAENLANHYGILLALYAIMQVFLLLYLANGLINSGADQYYYYLLQALLWITLCLHYLAHFGCYTLGD